jgi:hypothetical protein
VTGQHLPYSGFPLRCPPRSSRTPVTAPEVIRESPNPLVHAGCPSGPAPCQPVTVTPSGTLPTVTDGPGVPLATATGVTVLALVLTTQAVAPPGANPTA